MIISRTKFFIAIALLITTPLVIAKLVWLARTKTTTGTFSFEGMGNALDQMRPTYSVISFVHNNDTTWFNATAATMNFKPGDHVPVRYNVSDPEDATIDTFSAIWTGTLIFGGIPVFILLIISLDRHIVPYRSRIRFSKKKPYIFVLETR